MIETTSLGAAYAAGLAVGYWNDLYDLTQNWGIDKIWEPQMQETQRATLYAEWKKTVERSFGWVE
jgi:glycerol kinase